MRIGIDNNIYFKLKIKEEGNTVYIKCNRTFIACEIEASNHAIIVCIYVCCSSLCTKQVSRV